MELSDVENGSNLSIFCMHEAHVYEWQQSIGLKKGLEERKRRYAGRHKELLILRIYVFELICSKRWTINYLEGMDYGPFVLSETILYTRES